MPGNSIMGLTPHLAYLAKLSMESLEGLESIEDDGTRAREPNVRFIVYSAFEESYFEGLRPLRDPTRVPQEFRVVYEHLPTKTLVYESARPSDRQKPRSKARPKGRDQHLCHECVGDSLDYSAATRI